MDLVEIFNKAPLWLKVDLVIIQLASLYAALRALRPVGRIMMKSIVMTKHFIQQILEQITWCLYHPVVRLSQYPTRIEKVSTSESEVVYNASFQIEVTSRDNEDTHIMLSTVSLTAKQGSGIRLKELSLSRDARKTEAHFVIKPNLTSIIIVYVKNNQYSPDWKTSVDLGKKYNWKIKGIGISIQPAISKSISFTGKNDEGDKNG